jgi:hypothetical protein
VHATLFRYVNGEPAGEGVGRSDQLAPFHCAPRVPALEFPVAVHADADAQDTLSSSPPPCDGLGVAWRLHLVPFHRSARVLAVGVKGSEAPTAVHADADVQDTPLRKPPPRAGLRVAWIVHLLPFQLSARVPALDAPTAVHADADVQETALRLPCGGEGVAWMLHLVPFHRSARVLALAPKGLEPPTAVHADADVQDTPSRLLTAAPGGLGMGNTRQEWPFHCSARLTPGPEGLVYVPTAMHESAAGQDTQKSWPVGTRGFGLGVIDHPPPQALAGTARAPTRSSGTSSNTNLFIAIPSLAARTTWRLFDLCTTTSQKPHSRG